MNRFAVVFAGALLGAVGLTHSAWAVALVDTTGYVGVLPSIVIDGETFTEQSCTVSLCTGLQMLQDGSNIGVTISSQTNGGSIISGTYPAGADLGLELSVSGTASIHAVGLAVTGSNGGNVANNTVAGFGETITSSPTTTGTVTLATSGVDWLNLPSGYTSLDLTKDIFVHGHAGRAVRRSGADDDRRAAVGAGRSPRVAPVSPAVLSGH